MFRGAFIMAAGLSTGFAFGYVTAVGHMPQWRDLIQKIGEVDEKTSDPNGETPIQGEKIHE